MKSHPSWQFCVAPMMDWTDRHFRYLMRLIHPHARLYTEMVTTGALIHGDKTRHLAFSPQEHPIALQLGGHDPEQLALCARMGEDAGYDEINLNIGCPSSRVQSGQFGACLMAKPDLVADCVAKMQQAVKIPVTVKNRIGIDACEDYGFLQVFIEKIHQASCNTFIIHARNAWLNGLNPKENREIPPLRYDVVYRLKKEYPHLTIIINGGITEKTQVEHHLQQVDGVMIGRSAYQDPYYWQTSGLSRTAIAQNYLAYMHTQINQGERLWPMARHLLNLFNGVKGARHWRQTLSTHRDIKLIEQALIHDAV